MGIRNVDASHEFYSNPPRLTYRKGVLICSGSAGSYSSGGNSSGAAGFGPSTASSSSPSSSSPSRINSQRNFSGGSGNNSNNINNNTRSSSSVSPSRERRESSTIRPRTVSFSTVARAIVEAGPGALGCSVSNYSNRTNNNNVTAGTCCSCSSSASSAGKINVLSGGGGGTTSSSGSSNSCHPTSITASGSQDRRRSVAISNILQGKQKKQEQLTSSSSSSSSVCPTLRRYSCSHISSGKTASNSFHHQPPCSVEQLKSSPSGASSSDPADLEEEEQRLMAYLNQQQPYNNPYSQSNGHPPNQNQNNNVNNNVNITTTTTTTTGGGGGTTGRRDSSKISKEFIPSFVLVDACKANNERKVRELVRRMSSLRSEDVDPVVNFQDNSGRTALSYACASGNVMLIDELSKLRRLDPNLSDNEKNAPLHYASQAGHSEVVDLLLTRFDGVIDPNCRTGTGMTPLMKAGLQGRTRCAKSLISAGASAHLRDYSRGLTAAEWARLCSRHMTAEVIIRAAKDNYQSPHSPTSTYSRHRPLPVSQSALELKRINSEESPYYHLYAARNTISGATWLKNKIKKALGSTSGSGNSATSGYQSSNSNNSYGGGRKSESFALLANLSGPTICAGSLILPSIKPLIEQQGKLTSRKQPMTIPTLQVTPVKR